MSEYEITCTLALCKRMQCTSYLVVDSQRVNYEHNLTFKSRKYVTFNEIHFYS